LSYACFASSYYEDYNGLCEPCSSEAVLNSFALIVVLVILAVLLVYFSVKYTLYAARQSNNRYILSLLDEVEHRVLKLAQGAVARAQSFALSTKSSKSKAKSEQASTRSDLSSQRTSIIRAQKIVVKLKILFGEVARVVVCSASSTAAHFVTVCCAPVFFQVILLFDQVYLIKFPDVYLKIINIFSFLSFDWFQVAQLDCVTQVPLSCRVVPCAVGCGPSDL
jgi:hypothetical protein